MLNLRLIVPPRHTGAAVGLLRGDRRVTNVIVWPGAARDPAGDVVSADVAREAASWILERLREVGVEDGGSISLEEIVASPSATAARAEHAARGAPDDAVVWDIVAGRAIEDARSSWSFYAFLCLATTIAAVAVILDQPILVVGAMVVGPEFGAVAAVATGLVLTRPRLVLAAGRLLLLAFPAAIVLTGLLALLARAAGWITVATLTRPRPQTAFIYEPGRWSLLVALLAGIAGVLSLTAGRTQALVGVFISVTTVPAAGNLALALALWVPSQAVGSAEQLGINLAGMVVAGTLTLLVQRAVWRGAAPVGPPPAQR